MLPWNQRFEPRPSLSHFQTVVRQQNKIVRQKSVIHSILHTYFISRHKVYKLVKFNFFTLYLIKNLSLYHTMLKVAKSQKPFSLLPHAQKNVLNLHPHSSILSTWIEKCEESDFTHVFEDGIKLKISCTDKRILKKTWNTDFIIFFGVYMAWFLSRNQWSYLVRSWSDG